MTCIAAIVEHGIIHMAGDTATATGWIIHTSTQPKVFVHHGFAFGVSGDVRTAQLLRHAFTPPEYGASPSLECYINTEFINALRDCLKDGGLAQKESEQEKHGSIILVGSMARLFTVHSNYSVTESTENFVAIGSGEEYATGSLYTTRDSSLLPVQRLEIALRCAERYLGNVKSPFTFVRLEMPVGSVRESNKEEGVLAGMPL